MVRLEQTFKIKSICIPNTPLCVRIKKKCICINLIKIIIPLKICLNPNMDFKGNCRVTGGKSICFLSPCCFRRARNLEGKGDCAVSQSVEGQEQW